MALRLLDWIHFLLGKALMLVLSVQHLKAIQDLHACFGKQWVWLFYYFEQSVISLKEVNEIFWEVY